jgi:hypothetical protein
MNAGSASLADIVIPEELAGKRLLECYGSSRADLSTPAAMHTAAEVYLRLSFHPQASVFCQLPVVYFNA